MSERRRFALLAAVLLLVAAGAVVNAVSPRSEPEHVATAPPGQPSVAVTSATSSAWYCPGPLPVGDRAETSAIAVANLTHRRLIGRLEVVPAAGPATEQAVVVPAASQIVVPLAGRGVAAQAAAKLLLDGAGTAVSELVRGPGGAQSAPCSESPSSATYLPAGSTKGAANLALSIYNPTATTAVADVSVTTGTSTELPPALQGLIVAAGQLLVVDVGRQVPQQAVVGTTVTTTAGEVVTGAQVVFPHVGGGTIDALTSAAAQAATSWWFAPAPQGPGTREVFAVLDPGSAAAAVDLRVGGTPGGTVLHARVPAGGVVQLAVPGGSSSSLCWAELTSEHGRAVVAARETLVDDQPLAVQPTRGKAASTPAGKAAAGKEKVTVRAAVKSTSTTASKPATGKPVTGKPVTGKPVTGKPATGATTTTLPTHTPSGAPLQRPRGSLSAPLLASGATVALGSTTPSSGWLLPGDENDAALGELVVVANPGRSSASVRLQQLPASVSGATGAAGAAQELSVGPGQAIAWTPPLQSPGAAPYGLVVRASFGVVTEAFLFGRSTAGGLTSLSAVPIAR